jgi:CDP-glycerol glycerophosphotransferase (TagB/SpsB family)
VLYAPTWRDERKAERPRGRQGRHPGPRILDFSKCADAYKAFTDRFCPLDDGKAAARVLDRVLP